MPTSKWRFSIPSLRSSVWTFFWSRSPMSSVGRLRLCGESSPMTISWLISKGIELPLTLCAGVGSVVIDVIDVVMLVISSLVLGDNCEGLCGVCGWKDMVDRWRRATSGEMILAAPVGGSGDLGQRKSGRQSRLHVSDFANERKSTKEK